MSKAEKLADKLINNLYKNIEYMQSFLYLIQLITLNLIDYTYKCKLIMVTIDTYKKRTYEEQLIIASNLSTIRVKEEGVYSHLTKLCRKIYTNVFNNSTDKQIRANILKELKELK